MDRQVSGRPGYDRFGLNRPQPVVRYVNPMRLRTDIWPPQAAESRRARTVTFLLFEVT
jgi:hypothetical protein